MSRPPSALTSDAKQGTPITPVILCGSTGTRLWPPSRATYPKQYWALAGEGDDTQRLARKVGVEELLVEIQRPLHPP